MFSFKMPLYLAKKIVPFVNLNTFARYAFPKPPVHRS